MKIEHQDKFSIGRGASASSYVTVAILMFLVAVFTLAAHWPVLNTKAISFDDGEYVTENYLVQNPSWKSAKKFLTEVLRPSTVGGYYQPLTMISLMLDYSIAGSPKNLRPFHITSLAIHTANTLLIIVVLYMLFGSAFAAALAGLVFGCHPMTVETIAWLGERKTILAAFFALWCFIFYLRYASAAGRKYYILCFVMYLLALMSKPTSTPIPALLLILDYWPLRRLSKKTVFEKMPFFIIGGVSAVITVISQARTAGILTPAKRPLTEIFFILCHNIVFYPFKIFWPLNLSSHYQFPYPMSVSNPAILAGLIGTLLLFVFLVFSLRKTSVFAVGWLFFFVAIFPTMGVIGFTNVIASDKFAYLPSLGLLIILAWLLAGVLSKSGRYVGVVTAVLLIAGIETNLTRGYLTCWRDTETLFRYMLTKAPLAHSLHNSLGVALGKEDRLGEAAEEYKVALELNPNSDKAHYNLAIILLAKGHTEEAIGHFESALKNNPAYPDAHINMGLLLFRQGKVEEAIDHYNQALKIQPEHPVAHNNLALALASQHKTAEAVEHLEKAIDINPRYVNAYFNLANLLLAENRIDEAVDYYAQACRIEPNDADVRFNLALALTRLGRTGEAIAEYRDILKIAPNDAEARRNLDILLKKAADKSQ